MNDFSIDTRYLSLGEPQKVVEEYVPETAFEQLSRAFWEYRWDNGKLPDVIYMNFTGYRELINCLSCYERRAKTHSDYELFEGVPVIYSNAPTESNTWFRFFNEEEIKQAFDYFETNPNQSVFYYYDNLPYRHNFAINHHLPKPSGIKAKKIHRDVVRAYIQYVVRKETNRMFGQFNEHKTPETLMKSRLDYKFGFEINPGY